MRSRSPWKQEADSRVGKKYLGWGLGYGGPCLPRDNRSLYNNFYKGVGLEYNLGYVTDGFNNEHDKIICDYWDTMNRTGNPSTSSTSLTRREPTS